MPQTKTAKKAAKPAPKPKAARGPKGAGTVFYSKRRKCYVARRPVGTRLTRGGRRRTLYLERTGKTEREAIRRRDAAAPPGPATTVAEWAERWLAGLDVREQTRDDYRNTVERRVVPSRHLGHRRVAEVTVYDVECARTEWGQAASANTVKKALTHTRALFAAACRAGLRPDNPAALVKKPRGTRTDIDPFTAAELRGLVAAAAARPRLHRIALMAALGLRAGEALALSPADYDPAAHTLSVTKTRTQSYGIGPPKSPNSVRTLGVPRAVRAAAAAPGPLISKTALDERWYALLAELGLRRRNPHQARHSVATHALARNVPLANVARDLGDTPETVLRVYAHPTAGPGVCEAMEALLGGKKVAGGGRGTRKTPGKRPRGRAGS